MRSHHLDPGAKTQLPFAALPHDLRKDPRLRGKDKAILLAAALLEYARDQALVLSHQCPPGQDLGCCEQTVRTALAHLQDAGWIRIVLGANQPNGRTIWLLWRGEQIPGERRRGPSRDRCPTPPSPLDPSPSRLDLPPSPLGPK